MTFKNALPRYSGSNRSGTCICGHQWNDHHLGLVARQDYVDATGELYIVQECEYFGVNEESGLDAEGNPHCGGYLDNTE